MEDMVARIMRAVLVYITALEGCVFRPIFKPRYYQSLRIKNKRNYGRRYGLGSNLGWLRQRKNYFDSKIYACKGYSVRVKPDHVHREDNNRLGTVHVIFSFKKLCRSYMVLISTSQPNISFAVYYSFLLCGAYEILHIIPYKFRAPLASIKFAFM